VAQPSWSEVVSALNDETSDSARLAFERGEAVGARQFLWEPLRLAWRALRERRPGAEVVLAGYRAVLHAGKLWELEERWRGESAVSFSVRGRQCIARRGWREIVNRILDPDVQSEPIEGGRGGTVRISTPRGAVVLRPYRRGGAVRWLGGTFFGFRQRPFREFWTLLAAWRCRLPVVEPVAAIVERGHGPWYRGWLVTIEVGDAQPLTRWMRANPMATAVAPLAASLRAIHAAGLSHPDLNLGNLLVREGPSFLFLDFDRARLGGRPLARRRRRAALRRLRRSARKLDPEGAAFPDAALDRLESLYWSGADS
jgi:3-deoxy-D-manno-octulosonic acid kinase